MDKTPEKNKADRERWAKRYPYKHRAVHDLSVIRKRSKDKGWECDLDKEWMYKKYIGLCEVTGLPFDYSYPLKGSDYTHNHFAPSVDRTDNNKGYTKDNCKVVVWIYNRAKGNGTHKDVVKMSKSLIITLLGSI
jgi:hypothetical protein